MDELRDTLRALYDGQGDHLTALGVARERLATERDTFLTESRATLAAVRREPYAAEAAVAGQGRDEVDAADAAVSGLSQAAGRKASAAGSRKGATDARDGAYADFQTWMTRFRRFARIALKDHPDVAARVGL